VLRPPARAVAVDEIDGPQQARRKGQRRVVCKDLDAPGGVFPYMSHLPFARGFRHIATESRSKLQGHFVSEILTPELRAVKYRPWVICYQRSRAWRVCGSSAASRIKYGTHGRQALPVRGSCACLNGLGSIGERRTRLVRGNRGFSLLTLPVREKYGRDSSLRFGGDPAPLAAGKGRGVGRFLVRLVRCSVAGKSVGVWRAGKIDGCVPARRRGCYDRRKHLLR
jgi:hypothetical protein